MWWMLRNSRGHKDALLTMAVAGVLVCLAKVLLGGLAVAWGDKKVAFGIADATTVAAMTALVTAYTAKRIGRVKEGPVAP